MFHFSRFLSPFHSFFNVFHERFPTLFRSSSAAAISSSLWADGKWNSGELHSFKQQESLPGSKDVCTELGLQCPLQELYFSCAARSCSLHNALLLGQQQGLPSMPKAKTGSWCSFSLLPRHRSICCYFHLYGGQLSCCWLLFCPSQRCFLRPSVFFIVVCIWEVFPPISAWIQCPWSFAFDIRHLHVLPVHACADSGMIFLPQTSFDLLLPHQCHKQIF